MKEERAERGGRRDDGRGRKKKWGKNLAGRQRMCTFAA